MLKENNVSPTKWPLGRVIKVHPSTDGMVRTVTLRSTNDTGQIIELPRPILKLCLPPVNGEEESISSH